MRKIRGYWGREEGILREGEVIEEIGREEVGEESGLRGGWIGRQNRENPPKSEMCH
jgi:hypothetical protein